MAYNDVFKSKVYTVSEINNFLKEIFDNTPEFHGITLKGELNGFKKHSSGHFFFNLRDENSVISAVIYSFNVKSEYLNFADGDLVEATGSLSIYNKRGTYTFVINKLQKAGIGDVLLKKKELIQKLDKMGYFDPSIKKEIPKFPKTIGIITSPTGAAIRDIEKNIRLRNKNIQLILFPTLVQGHGAVESILNSIEKSKNYELDTLIIGRGGGSNDDLSAFDDEKVAIAIHNLDVPVISAVGHEIDKCVCDYVADLSVSTPTAAAVAAVQNTEDIISYLNKVNIDMNLKLNYLIQKYRERIYQIENLPLFKDKNALVENILGKIRLIDAKLDNSVKEYIRRKKQSIEIKSSIIDAINPKTVLERGYSIIVNNDKKILKTVNEINNEKELTIIVSDGETTIKKE